MGMLGSFRTMVHREPIIMWSFIIGGIGKAFDDSYLQELKTCFILFLSY